MIDASSVKKIKKVNLSFNLTPFQESVDSINSRYKLWRGGRRSGKTLYGVWWMLNIAKKANSIIWMVGPSYRQVKEIAWRKINRIIPRGAIKSKNETDLSIVLVNGSMISLKGSDNEDSLRGPADGLDGVWMEEASLHRGWIWEEILRPQLADKRGSALFTFTPKGQNWIWRIEQRALDEMKRYADKSSWSVFHSTIMDNPFISREEIEEIKSTSSEHVWRTEYLAEYDSIQGLVYPDFDENVHVVSPLTMQEVNALKSRGVPIYRSFDWGLRNPSCCLWSYIVQSVPPKIRFFKEHYRSELTISQHCQIIKSSSEGMKISQTFCDPSMRNRNNQGISPLSEFSRMGIYMLPSENNVSAGIEIVRRMLRERLVEFTSDMVNTISEFRTYEWDDFDDIDKNSKEKPRKYHDHAMDAVKYMLMSLSRRLPGYANTEVFSDDLMIPNAIPIGREYSGLDAVSGYY